MLTQPFPIVCHFLQLDDDSVTIASVSVLNNGDAFTRQAAFLRKDSRFDLRQRSQAFSGNEGEFKQPFIVCCRISCEIRCALGPAGDITQLPQKREALSVAVAYSVCPRVSSASAPRKAPTRTRRSAL